MNFRRYYIPDQIVFITQCVNKRQHAFNDSSNTGLLFEILKRVNEYHPFTNLAYVILPDHLHMLMQPSGKSNFSQVMHSIKSNFTHQYKIAKNIQSNTSFWQKRFWDHVIRDENDLENHLYYIHDNPRKHGYIDDPFEWKDSSILEWQDRGAYGDGFSWQEPSNSNWGE